MIDLGQLEKIRTAEEIAIEQDRENALRFLRETDWYVIRQGETGTPIPDEIKEKRLDARNTLSDT